MKFLSNNIKVSRISLMWKENWNKSKVRYSSTMVSLSWVPVGTGISSVGKVDRIFSKSSSKFRVLISCSVHQQVLLRFALFHTDFDIHIHTVAHVIITSYIHFVIVLHQALHIFISTLLSRLGLFPCCYRVVLLRNILTFVITLHIAVCALQTADLDLDKTFTYIHTYPSTYICV